MPASKIETCVGKSSRFFLSFSLSPFLDYLSRGLSFGAIEIAGNYFEARQSAALVSKEDGLKPAY